MLVAMLTDGQMPAAAGCASWYEAALGHIDGDATDRVASRLATVATEWSPTEERRALEMHRRRYAMGLLARSLTAEALWTAALPVAHIAGEQRRVAIRRQRAAEGRSMAASTLRRQGVHQDGA